MFELEALGEVVPNICVSSSVYVVDNSLLSVLSIGCKNLSTNLSLSPLLLLNKDNSVSMNTQ